MYIGQSEQTFDSGFCKNNEFTQYQLVNHINKEKYTHTIV